MNKSKKRLTLTQRKILNAVIILVALLILVGANILSTVLVDRFPGLESDITSKGFYSLNDTAAEFFEYLDKDVKITVLMPEENFENQQDDLGSAGYYFQANKLLRQMSVYDKVTLEYTNLATASQSVFEKKYPDADWTSNSNLVIVEHGDKYEVLTDADLFTYDMTYLSYYNYKVITAQSIEQEVIKAAQKVTSDKVLKVAVSVGNGEFLNESSQNYANFSGIVSLLDFNAYDMVNVNLLTEELTEDIDALIMMAPEVDMTNEQVEKVSAWLENGGNYGKTFLYIPNDYNVGKTPNTDLFIEQWGMKVKNGYIIENDLTMTLQQGAPRGLAKYADVTYTEGLTTTMLSVYMPYCLGVEITDENLATAMLTTSDDASLAILGSETGETVKSDKALNYAASATKGNSDLSKKSTVIVWGSYDAFRYDSLTAQNYNNANYALNMMDTALGNENESVVIRGTDLTVESITVNSAQKTGVLITFVFAIPVLVAVVGIVVWVRRKNK